MAFLVFIRVGSIKTSRVERIGPRVVPKSDDSTRNEVSGRIEGWVRGRKPKDIQRSKVRSSREGCCPHKTAKSESMPKFMEGSRFKVDEPI